VGPIGVLLLLCVLAGTCGAPTVTAGQADDGDKSGPSEGAVEEPSEEQLAAIRADLASIDHYMVALKAIHRWQEAVTPVETKRRSRLLRRELGGSETPELLLAQRKLWEARAVLEGAPVSRDAAADLRGAIFQGIHRALEAVGDFRLVGAELDPEFFASGSLKLCLADERMLQAVNGLHRFLASLREDAEAAGLLAVHGPDLELHAAYLRTRGCH
jgi:hypothetical protein